MKIELNHLDMSYNKLTTVPDAISSQTRIVNLDFSGKYVKLLLWFRIYLFAFSKVLIIFYFYDFLTNWLICCIILFSS